MKEFSYPSKHGKLRGVIWDEVKKPIATVQIFHGLVEYHARYDETAKFLNKNGIIIIHRHKKDDLKITDNLNILDVRNYGISKIIIGN